MDDELKPLSGEDRIAAVRLQAQLITVLQEANEPPGIVLSALAVLMAQNLVWAKRMVPGFTTESFLKQLAAYLPQLEAECEAHDERKRH